MIRTHTILIAGIFAACAVAQAQTSAPDIALAPGMTLNAELNSSIDSKKAKVGDKVEAHTTEALRSDGKTIIPRGTKLLGRVTQTLAKGKGDNDSVLAIQFDQAVPKKGQEMPLSLAIRAIGAPQGATPTASSGPGADPMGDAGAARAGGSPMGGGSRPPTPTPPGSAPPANPADDTSNRGTNGGSEGAPGGMNSAGQLTANSRGVFGLSGIRLVTDPANAATGPLISSSGKSVRLDSGTRLLLVAQTAESAAPGKQ
jgi:hypothetical protein